MGDEQLRRQKCFSSMMTSEKEINSSNAVITATTLPPYQAQAWYSHSSVDEIMGGVE